MTISTTQKAIVGLFASTSSAALYNQVIDTKYGSVQGYPAFNSTPAANLTNWKDITVFKGIPFAADTSGKNRFRAPQPAAPWNTTLDAKNYGDICPSGGSGFTISENCLNLNVWTAANSTDAKLPVVMWSYPAGGSAADSMFDGAGMADKGVVFVNYNYRTGAFGWMAHPELNPEVEAATGHNVSGNWGMLDQFAAVKWIHENIASFGGDPEHITVMGQSAGSAATYHILNSALTKDLIVGAIIESGVRDPHDPLCTSLAENYQTLPVALETGVSFLKSLNISSIAAAREVNYTTLVTQFLSSTFDFTATLDYYAMPDTYYNTLIKGLAHQVPVLTGNTKDESGATYGLNISLSTYLSDVNSTYNGTWINRFLEAYPANDSTTASGAYNSQWTDRSKIGTWLWTQLWASNSTQPVYNYIWDHAPPNQTQGAYHESEIYYVLNNLYANDKPWTLDDYEIADTMNAYWANFIKTGDPNGDGLVQWNAASDEPLVQEVGNEFQEAPVGSAAKVALYKEWFAGLKAY